MTVPSTTQPTAPEARRGRWRRRLGRTLGPVLAAATALALVVTSGLRPPAAEAQLLEPPRAHQGYYIALGYRLAINHNWEDNRSWGTWTGTDFSIRLGQIITRRFGLGLQIHSGRTKGEGQQAAIGGLSVEAQWELFTNFAVRGGAGVDIVSLSSQAGPNPTTRGTVGTGYFLGFDYSWFFTHRLTGGWALTPMIEGRLVPGDTAGAIVGLVGLQIAYWTGLPRNQLDLPPGQGFEK